ncbi:MAG: hypothetical protein WCI05_08640 [Myxococcales bacterium]
MLATKGNLPPAAMSAIFSFNHTDKGGPSIHIGFNTIFHNDDGTTTMGKPVELQIWVAGAPSSLVNDIKAAYDILKFTVSTIVDPEMDVEKALKFIYDSLDEANKVSNLVGDISMQVSGEADGNHFNAGIVQPGDGLDSTSVFHSYAQKTTGATNRIDVIVYHPNYPSMTVGSFQHALYIQVYTIMDDCDQVLWGGASPDRLTYCNNAHYQCLPNSPNSSPVIGGNGGACNQYFTDPDNYTNPTQGVPLANKVVMNVHSYAQVAAYVGAN